MDSKTAIKLPSETVKYSKNHAQYWLGEGRLFQQHGKPEYCCRFSHNGRRGFFDLNTPNRLVASKRAAERYRLVVADGWEEAVRNPELRTQPAVVKVEVLTVGTWIKHVRSVSLVTPLTLRSYEQALRRIAAGAVLGIQHNLGKHDSWREQVDAVPLASLTGNTVAKWVKERMSQAGNQPTVEESATHTINHVLRSAKALFSQKRIIPRIPAEVVEKLPAILPLSDVRLLQEDSSARFTPQIDPESLVVLARDELGNPRQQGESLESFALREQLWVAFLLCFCGGLRRKESDLLTWWQVRLDERERPRIELEVTKYFRPKNRAHSKAIPLDVEFAAILRRYRTECPNETFVLRSARPVNLKTMGKPRCHETWQALMNWLRRKGINEIKPIHGLRKAVGALMARRHGIHAAQRLLRHTTPSITSKYYSDSEARETPGLDALLAFR